MITKTPAKKRDNHESVLEQIKTQASVLITPAKDCSEPVNRGISGLDPPTTDDHNENDCTWNFDNSMDDEVNSNEADYPVIQTYSQLMRAFPIEFKKRRNVPLNLNFRSNPNVANDLPSESKKLRSMVNVLSEVVTQIAKIVLPGDPKYLLSQYYNKLNARVEWLSIQYRKQEIERKISNMLMTLATRLPRHTTSYRVVRAVICSAATPKSLATCFGSNDEENAPPEFKRKARKIAYHDITVMMDGNEDPRKMKRSIQRKDDRLIEEAVVHIFSHRNVGEMSWGTKELVIPGTNNVVSIPAVTLNRSREEMWEEYRKEMLLKFLSQNACTRGSTNKASDHLICRSSYIKLASSLTARSEKIVRSVDYTVDRLLNEVIPVLQKIIDDLVIPVKKRQFTRLLSLIQTFLKYQFDDHLSVEGDGVSCFQIEKC